MGLGRELNQLNTNRQSPIIIFGGFIVTDYQWLFSEEDDSPEPEPRPLQPTSKPNRRSRILGAVLGAAIGDAMGHPTEFISSFEGIYERYGPEGVTKFELYREDNGRRYAPYTDDTQMAEVVLRTLLAGHDDLEDTMTRMAKGFVQWSHFPQGGHRAPGNACMSGCRRLEHGVLWSEGGGERAGGCGSVMRAYPFGLVFADDINKAEQWSVQHSRLTHRDPIALAACAAMAVAMVRILREEDLDIITAEMIAATARYSGPTSRMMMHALHDAYSGVGPHESLQRLQAWAAHEAICAATYIFARYPNDFRAAILEGANTPGDSDSIATIAGALVGANCGVEAIPSEWVRDVERSEELQELAKSIPA